MVQGYHPLIKTLSYTLDMRLNCRVKSIIHDNDQVLLTAENGETYEADAVVITVPIGVLKADAIKFEPELPKWKRAAISDIGVGNENKIALLFDSVFWPDVEFLGVVAHAPHSCGYFLNLHKATGHHVLVFMAAGSFASDLEKLSDEEAANYAMILLKKTFFDAPNPVTNDC